MRTDYPRSMPDIIISLCLERLKLPVCVILLMGGGNSGAQEKTEFSAAVQNILARTKEPVFRNVQYDMSKFGPVGAGILWHLLVGRQSWTFT